MDKLYYLFILLTALTFMGLGSHGLKRWKKRRQLHHFHRRYGMTRAERKLYRGIK